MLHFLKSDHDFEKGSYIVLRCFIMTNLIEKRQEFNVGTHRVFVDYENTFGRIKKIFVLWDTHVAKSIPRPLLNLIKRLNYSTQILTAIRSQFVGKVPTNYGVQQEFSQSLCNINIYSLRMCLCTCLCTFAHQQSTNRLVFKPVTSFLCNNNYIV